jgi:protein-S-isoprenylcysteine O-methyltransferase Ste14
MKSNNIIRIFLLIVGNALALILALLGLETTPTNFLGWFVMAVSIAYGAGGVIYFWLSRDKETAPLAEQDNHSFWWILPGFVAIFFAPPAEFLFLKSILPRGISMELAGLMLILLGFSVRVWTRMFLRGQYSGYLRVKVGHLLVTDGPYRFVRLPGYSGFLLIALGLCIGYSSLIGLIAIPVLLLPGLVYRMRVEERLLVRQFGEEYRNYIANSKKLIPVIW